MILAKNKKLFQVRYLHRAEPEKQIYNFASLRGRFGSKERNDIEVIEYDLVEVGRISFNDLSTRFPRRK